MKRFLPYLLLLSASLASAAPFKAGAFDPPRAAPAFTLESTAGGALSMQSYAGKVVVLGFGFTACPEVCPTTLSTLAAAMKQLGAKSDDVQVVWITVDPERDNAKQLGDYLKVFDARFVGGTGNEETLAAVRKEYGVMAAKQQRDGAAYSYSHSAFTYLIDREGRIRALMPYGRPAADFAHDLALLVDEK